MFELPTRDDFAKQLNTKFRAEISAEQTAEMELTEVSELRKHSRHEYFALIFLAPEDTPPEQRLYKMHHDALGAQDIFLAPLSKDERGVVFEAVFNRLVSPAGD